MRDLASALVWFLVIAVSGAGGALGGALYVRHQDPPPKVVVIDVAQLATSVVNDSQLSEPDRQRRLLQVGRAASQLASHYAQNGAIVLDSSAVLQAPRSVYVEP